MKDVDTRSVGKIRLFRTNNVIIQANNVKIKVATNTVLIGKSNLFKITKNNIPIKGICMPKKAMNKNFKE